MEKNPHKGGGTSYAKRIVMNGQRQRGFTATEFLVLLGTLVLLILLIPLSIRSTRCGYGGARIQCVSNQKQIVLAMRMWAYDHGDKLPMELSATKGGARESALAGVPVAAFTLISNELCSPKVLACPEDAKREQTTNFATLTYRNLSYFLGVDASETNAAAILTGDRNISLTNQMTNGLMQITVPGTANWTTHIHKNAGNLAFADGSAMQATAEDLRRSLRGSGLATNRFAIP
jgi:prepilin-type processing-associated H-X9-DG protein